VKRETAETIGKLASLLRIPESRVIDSAVYEYGIKYGVSGAGVEWERTAEKRGYRKGNQ
jgi:hypothetical protein